MEKSIDEILEMSRNGIFSRDAVELEIGQSMRVPYKYCSFANLRRSISELRAKGYDFEYDSSRMEYALVTRTK